VVLHLPSSIRNDGFQRTARYRCLFPLHGPGGFVPPSLLPPLHLRRLLSSSARVRLAAGRYPPARFFFFSPFDNTPRGGCWTTQLKSECFSILPRTLARYRWPLRLRFFFFFSSAGAVMVFPAPSFTQNIPYVLSPRSGPFAPFFPFSRRRDEVSA